LNASAGSGKDRFILGFFAVRTGHNGVRTTEFGLTAMSADRA